MFVFLNTYEELVSKRGIRSIKKKIIIILPTFSPYYEFVKEGTEVVYYKLTNENNFKLDIYDYINFVKKHRPNTIVLINPNNPDGGYIKNNDL